MTSKQRFIDVNATSLIQRFERCVSAGKLLNLIQVTPCLIKKIEKRTQVYFHRAIVNIYICIIFYICLGCSKEPFILSTLNIYIMVEK